MQIKDYSAKYGFLLPPVTVLITNLLVSFATRPFISGKTYDMTTGWDRAIPFVPEFIYIYFLAFVQWAVCLISVMIVDKKVSRRYCTAISAANILSGIVFLTLPTVMTIRPEFSGGGALTEMLGRFLFSADTPPQNIMPSIHCLISWGCMRAVFAVNRIPKSLKIINAVFSFLVFASVLLVKQHCIIDVPAGILAFEAGFLMTRLAEKSIKGGKE